MFCSNYNAVANCFLIIKIIIFLKMAFCFHFLLIFQLHFLHNHFPQHASASWGRLIGRLSCSSNLVIARSTAGGRRQLWFYRIRECEDDRILRNSIIQGFLDVCLVIVCARGDGECRSLAFCYNSWQCWGICNGSCAGCNGSHNGRASLLLPLAPKSCLRRIYDLSRDIYDLSYN